jgi:hypothetical protein
VARIERGIAYRISGAGAATSAWRQRCTTA